MNNNIYNIFKNDMMNNVYETLKKKLEIISIKYNIPYKDLEEKYLKDIKENIN